MDPAFAAWAGPDRDPAPFKAYAEARRSSPFVAAEEPHRTWLARLLKSDSEPLRRWASVRLVEACATAKEGEARPEGYFLSVQETLFSERVLWGNLDDAKVLGPAVPWKELGTLDVPPANAPCWAVWREQLLKKEHPRVGLALYAIMAPRLQPEDGVWVLRCLRDEAQRGLKADPWRAIAFWIATDWLILHGWEQDWAAFTRELPKAWGKAFAQVHDELLELKEYGLPLHPGSRLDATGSSEGDAVRAEKADRPASFRRSSFLQPAYPARASDFGFSTTQKVRLTIGPSGEILALRPLPGYGLAMFAPTSMKWMKKWRFDPASAEGRPVTGDVVCAIQFERAH